jgi:HAMP domain-containing protein
VENNCLRCHGRPDEAPVEITQKYGTESGFGWQVGDINSLLMVLVPTDDLQQHAAMFRAQSQQLVDQHRVTSRNVSLILILSAFALIVALGVFFHFLVERRVARAADVMRQVASNVTASARIADSRKDEIGTMSQAFNRMADSLEAAHRQLEERVQARTKELSQANDRLQEHMLELARFSTLAVGREERMIELKRQVNELAEALGKPAPYDLSFLDDSAASGMPAPVRGNGAQERG